jgi:cold shock CspA family protein
MRAACPPWLERMYRNARHYSEPTHRAWLRVYSGREGGEVFFHHTALPSPDHFAALTIGMVVEFEAEPSPKGPRATRVTRMPELR